MAQDKVMIVDNEMEIIQLLKLYLSKEGYKVFWTTDPTKATQLCEEHKPDIILLDVVMPEITGFELCRTMREKTDVPILFISCKNEDMDKILGLSLGADDYISKPFSPAEVVARVQAHLRRGKLIKASEDKYMTKKVISIGNIEIDLDAHTVLVSGNQIKLTAKEYDLLVNFVKYPNRVFTPKQIFDQIWGSYGHEEDYRTVNVHISNLRKKIENIPGAQKHIITIRGVGYKFIS